MAQKASPYAIRLGYNQDWNNYFLSEDKQEQLNYLHQDQLIRNYLNQLFPDLTQLRIEYTKNNLFIYLYIPEVSLVLGENNEKLAKLIKQLRAIIKDEKVKFNVKLIDIKNPYSYAQSVANLTKSQLEKRLRFRQVLRSMVKKSSEEREVRGIKIQISGRLDGATIARTENISSGKMPLSMIDSNIEIGRAEAIMSYGVTGIKVLIYKGRKWQKKPRLNNPRKSEMATARE